MNMMKWGYQKETYIICECVKDQSDNHLLMYALAPPECITDNLALANEKTISIATYWLKQNISTFTLFYFIWVFYILT